VIPDKGEREVTAWADMAPPPALDDATPAVIDRPKWPRGVNIYYDQRLPPILEWSSRALYPSEHSVQDSDVMEGLASAPRWSGRRGCVPARPTKR
jgi:hypothetical protein